MLRTFRQETGFTLLEMMMVVAIICILMSLAIPSYQSYTQKAKFAEVIQAIAPYKTAVTICACQQGDLKACQTPGQNEIPENFQSGSRDKGYVKSIQVHDQGTITAISQRIILKSKTAFSYTLKPELQSNGSIVWSLDTSHEDSCKHFNLC